MLFSGNEPNKGLETTIFVASQKIVKQSANQYGFILLHISVISFANDFLIKYSVEPSLSYSYVGENTIGNIFSCPVEIAVRQNGIRIPCLCNNTKFACPHSQCIY